MKFGRANPANFDYEGKEENATLRESGNGFKRIMSRSRITEEDLEHFRLEIIKEHKKKHSRVLLVSAILFLCLLVLVSIFSF
ncbi:hypothetical protein [Christiangramia echinicola]|uniref:hypothetical protein n=1 Tax=Christiangramia echinicola TaxID=279359 RepID=UPI00047B44CF|nr:hypothetical protein [Christiangramia echinicola]